MGSSGRSPAVRHHIADNRQPRCLFRALLLRLGSAELKFTCQKLAFVAIQKTQGDEWRSAIRRRVLCLEVVHAAYFGSEMSRSSLMARSQTYHRLPARAKMMNTWIDGKIEIGVGVGCTHPLAIEAHPGSRPRSRSEIGIVLDEIHQRLARLWLCGVLPRIWFYFESALGRAARRDLCTAGGLVLCKSQRCEQKCCK